MSEFFKKYMNKTSQTPGPYPDSVVSKLLIPGGLLLVAIIGILTGAKELPGWALLVLVGFVVVIAVVIVSPAIQHLLRKLRASITMRRVSNRFYPQLVRISKRLQDHLGQNTSDTIIYELRNFASLRDKAGSNLLPDFTVCTNTSAWLHLFDERFRKRRVSEFCELMRALDISFSQYSSFCKAIEYRLRAIAAEKLVEEEVLEKLRQAWNHGRESQTRLLQDWHLMVQDVNEQLGTYVCGGYSPPLRELV